MTDEEIRIIKMQVDAVAEPVTLLALMWLLTNRDPHRTDGSYRFWGQV